MRYLAASGFTKQHTFFKFSSCASLDSVNNTRTEKHRNNRAVLNLVYKQLSIFFLAVASKGREVHMLVGIRDHSFVVAA